MVALQDPANSFFASRPAWTLNDVLITAPDGRAARVMQVPFVWSDGAWDASVQILPIEAPDGAQTLKASVRVTPDTLRRWKEMAINPFLEARAQLQEHWRSARGKDPGTLTLL